VRTEAAAYREVILAAVSRTPEDAVLFLSGGIDSATILAAALSLGRRPACVSFTLGPNPSPDAKVARLMTTETDVPLHLVVIDRSTKTLIRDTRRIIRIIGSSRKVAVQCCHGFVYLLEEATRLGASAGIIGMAAEELFGTTRAIQILYNTEGEAAARRMRREEWEDWEHPADAVIARMARDDFGVTLHDVYRDPTVAEYLLALDMDVIHRKRADKSLALEAFPEFWSRGAWHRPHADLQIVSGLREWHNTLLSSPINTRRVRAVVGVYNDILKEVQGAELSTR